MHSSSNFHSFCFFLSSCLCIELGVNCPGESSCEATRAAGELLVNTRASQTALCCFQKNAPEMSLNKTMKLLQLKFADWGQALHCWKKKTILNNRNCITFIYSTSRTTDFGIVGYSEGVFCYLRETKCWVEPVSWFWVEAGDTRCGLVDVWNFGFILRWLGWGAAASAGIGPCSWIWCVCVLHVMVTIQLCYSLTVGVMHRKHKPDENDLGERQSALSKNTASLPFCNDFLHYITRFM